MNSAVAEFICVYLIETAPQIAKEHQWIMPPGGFNNGQLVNFVEHSGVREQLELFSAHEDQPATYDRYRYNTLEVHCQIR